MIDTNKPMASKRFGKVTDWHIFPEWMGADCPLLCRFEDGTIMCFTKEGRLIRHTANADCDLYNIEDVPTVATGNNPHRLSVQAVGEGYRLLDADEYPETQFFSEVQMEYIEGYYPTMIEKWRKSPVSYKSFASHRKFMYRTRLTREEFASLVENKLVAEKQEWENWLSERPENVRKVAERIVPWKRYRDKRIANDIGIRYSLRSYEEAGDGTVTITCYKTNERMPILGGYAVSGINPDDLVEAD